MSDTKAETPAVANPQGAAEAEKMQFVISGLRAQRDQAHDTIVELNYMVAVARKEAEHWKTTAEKLMPKDK